MGSRSEKALRQILTIARGTGDKDATRRVALDICQEWQRAAAMDPTWPEQVRQTMDRLQEKLEEWADECLQDRRVAEACPARGRQSGGR